MIEAKLITCAVCQKQSEQMRQTQTNLENSIISNELKCTLPHIQQCPHCYYAQEDIEVAVAIETAKLVASCNYQKIANYSQEFCLPLVNSGFFAYSGYAFLCKESNKEKNALLALIKAAECKRSTAYELKTSFSNDDIYAQILLAEANQALLSANIMLSQWAEEMPQNGALLLLMIKYLPLEKSFIMPALERASAYLQNNNPSTFIKQALQKEMNLLINTFAAMHA